MFVYVVGLEHEPKFKVGVSNDVNNRIMSLQTGNPYKIVEYFRVNISDAQIARNVESKVHATLKPYHVSGEWFSCTLATVESALDFAVNKNPFVDYDEIERKLAENVYVQPEFSISPLVLHTFLIALILCYINYVSMGL